MGMAPARDLLALILGSTLAAVWAGYMAAQIVHGLVAETDWLILPTGTAALLGALQLRPPRYIAQHRER